MYKTTLEIEKSAHAVTELNSLKLPEASREDLAEAVRSALPHKVVQRLRAPTSSSVPLVVCSYTRAVNATNFVSALALFSRQEGGTAAHHAAMCADVMQLPFVAYNGGQLSDWFEHGVDQYYTRAVTRRLTAEGESNPSFDPDHHSLVPIAEFASPSIECAYSRLAGALADLNDDGVAHDRTGHIRAATQDAVSPAGVQLIHICDDGKAESCFVSFRDLIADADRLAMY